MQQDNNTWRRDAQHQRENLPAGNARTQRYQNSAAAYRYGHHEPEVLHVCKRHFAGVENVIVSATGYTGAGGVEIYFEDKDNNAEKIWNAIFELGESHRAFNPLAWRKRYASPGNGLLPVWE